jgi:hypothetical protein
VKFGDALEAMKRGRAIRRAEWPGGHHIQIGNGMVRRHRPGVGPYGEGLLFGKDILADDWELLNKPLSMTEGEPLGGIQNRTLAEADRSAA